MSRNASTPSPGPRKAPHWSSHLRQLSRSSLERRFDQPPQSPDTVSSQSTIRDLSSARRVRLDRRCTVTINDSFARDEVLLNLELLGSDIQPGTLMAIDVLKPEADKVSQNIPGKQHVHERGKEATSTSSNCSKAAEAQRRYIFVVKDMTKDLKTRYPTAELYVAKHIADVFGMKKGSQVLLTPVRPI